MIFTGSMEALLDGYRLIKGRPQDLTSDIKKNIIGLRKTEVGFEGLIPTKEAVQFGHCILDIPTIDDIVICINRGGAKK